MVTSSGIEFALFRGLMVQFMMEIGETIKLMEKANLFTQMVMCMKENGKMIRLMALECIGDKMGENMKVSGEMIYKKDKDMKNGI